jgi:hypothetical protein
LHSLKKEDGSQIRRALAAHEKYTEEGEAGPDKVQPERRRVVNAEDD